MTDEELKKKCTERARIFQQAMESCKSSNPMDCIEWFADRIADLEKENAELKEQGDKWFVFEKEAEEWANEMYPCDGQAQRYLIEGAEFGYNKANEWHYVKDGNYPKNNTQVLVLLENKRMKISTFMENKFTVWNKDYNTYTKLYNVIAWKEIVLPELPKESE